MPPQRKPSPLDGYGQYDFPMPSSSKRPPPQSLSPIPLAESAPPSPPKPRPSPSSNNTRRRPNRPVPGPIQVGGDNHLVRQTSAQRLAEKRREVGLRTRPTWEGEEQRGPQEGWITEDEEEAVDGLGSGGTQRQVRGTQYAYRPAYFTTGPTYSYSTTTTSTYSGTPSTSNTPPSPVAPINWDLGYAFKHDPEEPPSAYKAVLKTLSLTRRNTGPTKSTPQPQIELSPTTPAPEVVAAQRSRSPTQRRPLRYHWEAFSLRVRFGVFKAQKRVMACFTPEP